MNDPQLRVYLEHPERYATIADQVDAAMRISDRPCAGGQCDEGRRCRRHELAPAVAVRFVRLRAKRAAKGV